LLFIGQVLLFLFRFVTRGGQSSGCRPFSNSRRPIYNDIPPRGKISAIIQQVKPFFFEKDHIYNVPDLAEYDFILVAFSGGKNSTAAFLYLLDRGLHRNALRSGTTLSTGTAEMGHPAV
jgi:hypothetical protein